MKKFIALVMACLLPVLLLSGCSRIKDGAFLFMVRELPDTLDPQLADNSCEYTAAVNLFEGLFRKNAKGEAVPAACESYTVSGDGLTYTFTLKEGLTYHNEYSQDDGETTPVTAADFAFAFRRIFTPGSGSPYASTFSGIANAPDVYTGAKSISELGVRATDDRTLVIRLTQSDSGLLEKLCCPGAMPCNEAFFNATQGTYGLSADSTLANGLFRITLWSDTDGVTLRRIDAKNGLVNKVRLLPDDGSDPTARLEAGTTNGEFETGPSEDGTSYDIITRLLLFNCSDASLSSASIRAGLAGALVPVLKDLPQEGLSLAEGILPDSVTFGGENWRERTGDLLCAALPSDAAASYRAGLAELGEKKLSGITVLVPDEAPWRTLYDTIALAWQQQLSAFFSVEYKSFADILADVESGNYQIAFLPVTASENDVYTLLSDYSSVSADLSHFFDPQFDSLLAASLNAVSQQERGDRLQAAEAYLLSQWPVVPLYTEDGNFHMTDGFGGIYASPFGPSLDFSVATASN